MQRAVVGVDVGTGSARAGLFTLDGRRLSNAARPIRMWRELPGHAEQSSGDIWAAIRSALAEAMADAGPLYLPDTDLLNCYSQPAAAVHPAASSQPAGENSLQ